MMYITAMACDGTEADGTRSLGCQASSSETEAGGTQPLKYQKKIKMFENH